MRCRHALGRRGKRYRGGHESRLGCFSRHATDSECRLGCSTVARLDLESRQGCSNACRPGSDRGYPTVVPSRFGILTGIFSCPSVRSGSPIKWMNVPTQIPCSRHAKRNLELNEIVVRVLRFLVAVEALSSRFSFSCFAGREKACPPRRSSGRPGGLAPESRPLERSRGAGLRRPPSLARRAT